LNTEINLSSDSEYEAAMISMIYPNSVKNVYACQIYYYSWGHKRKMPTSLRQGYYATPEELIAEMSDALVPADKEYYKFEYEKHTHTFWVWSTVPEGVTGDPFMQFSDNLKILTGFTEDITKAYYTGGKYSMDMSAAMNTFYVYCDIIKPLFVGNARTPLLAIVAYDGNGPWSQQKEHEVKNPVYIPLRTNSIKTIQVEIFNKSSVPIKFTSGEVVLKLHVRKKLPKLYYAV